MNVRLRWRSTAARDLARVARRAGGTARWIGRGRLRITGPSGATTIGGLGDQTLTDLLCFLGCIERQTGLSLTVDHARVACLERELLDNESADESADESGATA